MAKDKGPTLAEVQFRIGVAESALEDGLCTAAFTRILQAVDADSRLEQALGIRFRGGTTTRRMRTLQSKFRRQCMIKIPAADGRCEPCREKSNTSKRSLRLKRLREGNCPTCGFRRDQETKQCSLCLEKQSVRKAAAAA